MGTDALTPEVIRSREISLKRFDPKDASPFVNKSVSEATRRGCCPRKSVTSVKFINWSAACHANIRKSELKGQACGQCSHRLHSDTGRSAALS